MQFAPDDNSYFRKADFLERLLVHVPSSLLNGRGDVLTADVPSESDILFTTPIPFQTGLLPAE